MASNNSSVLGIPSGKVGNLIVRIRNGKPFYYSVPANFKMSKTAAAKTGRNNFAASVALAKTVNAVPKLQEVWTNAKVPGVNSYQRLIKNNAKRVREGLLTTSNRITPDGLPLQINSAAVENNKLRLSFYCPAHPDLSFPASEFIFLYFGKASNAIVPLSRMIPEPAPDGNYTREFNLDSGTKKLLSKDPSPLVYLALAGSAVDKKKVYWTSTASEKL